jgi:hypothetical protein
MGPSFNNNLCPTGNKSFDLPLPRSGSNIVGRFHFCRRIAPKNPIPRRGLRNIFVSTGYFFHFSRLIDKPFHYRVAVQLF